MKLNNKGFTLIEILVSLILISIILLSFFQLFIQSNRTSAHNNEQLVVFNLADAALARIQSKTFTKIGGSSNLQDYFRDDARTPKTIALNEKNYTVSHSPSQAHSRFNNASFSEKELNLIRVVVKVTSSNRISGSSKGYVSIE